MHRVCLARNDLEVNAVKCRALSFALTDDITTTCKSERRFDESVVISLYEWTCTFDNTSWDIQFL